MNKLCKQYLSDIKAFFPIMGKSEKIYLAKLAETVEDYCAEENVTDLKEIYDNFGQPGEVAHTYLTGIGTSHLIKKVRLNKWIKRSIIAVLLLALIGISVYSIKSYKTYQLLEEEQIYFNEITIDEHIEEQ